MPRYKFFEVKQQEKQQVSFAEFELSKVEKSVKRDDKENDVDAEQKGFKALKMPDFNKIARKSIENCPKKQTLVQEF